MIKKTRSIPLILGLLMLTGILTACSSWFQPKTKTIEYDEEVKLHNGEMIWVHITRHYFLAGEVTHGASYMPGAVEISWDTGYEGVGRKSVFFDEQVFTIDYLDNQWYVYGATSAQKSIIDTVNCRNVGTLFFNNSNCLLRINSSGKFLKSDSNNLQKLKRGNILYHYGFEETKKIEKSNLSWESKLRIQSDKPKKFQIVNKEFNLT